jgi:tRNA pseudouridine32 synthase/23S rRNA pseudouridine746 synthase
VKILWQNEHAVLVEKPAKVLSVPGRTADDGRPVLGLQLQELLKQKIYPVHRLDFEVSGVMIYALTKQAHAALNLGFEKKEITKTYLAVTENQKTRPSTSVVWKRKILRGKKRSFESPVGDLAETHARILQENPESITWELKPITGKPHQLRLELYLQGFPILGDELYNSKRPWSHPGIALRAVKIEFPQAISDAFQIPPSFEVSPWT